MVDSMDRNIGRVFADLKRSGEWENTLVLFLSDNGACAEWDPWGFDINSGPQNVLHQGAELDGMGQPGTYHSYGSAWANVSNTPWRLYKHYNHEGGITTPFIAHWPDRIKRRGAIEDSPAHLIDLMPTLAETAGKPLAKSEGRSLLPAFVGRATARRPLYWEHEGNRAVRNGKWKIAAVGPAGPWELYDMERDRTEMHDLAAAHPDIVARMAAQWETWAQRTNVIPWIWEPQYRSPGK
jgi:arylsulfatase A-like enzyme